MDRRLRSFFRRLRDRIMPRRRRRLEGTLQIDLSDVNFQALRPSVIRYTREQIASSTNGFAHQIGHGGSGTVFKGKALDSDMEIAVKLLAEGQNYVNMWKTELTLLNKFEHENIINLVGYCPDPPSLAIITEFMENGNLRQHIDSDLNWFSRVKIAYDMAKAIQAVHAEGVALNDFKTSNILIDKDFTPKIGDFGIAASEEIPERWQLSAFGTHGYIDPREPYDRGPQVDVFGYGQMLYELLAKERYDGVAYSVRGQLYGQLVEGQDFHQKFAEDPSYSVEDGETLFRIAEECSKSVEERPQITAVVESFESLQIRRWLDL